MEFLLQGGYFLEQTPWRLTCVFLKLKKNNFHRYALKSFNMAAISRSITIHGMPVMEHDEPWKTSHDHAMVMVRLLCSMDHGKADMIFLHHGKPTVASIALLASAWKRFGIWAFQPPGYCPSIFCFLL